MSQDNQQRDQELWAIAEKRASFKKHLVIYLIVNAFLWGIWVFNDRNDTDSMPWPVWGSFGWGVGLAFHYAGAYMYNGKDSIQREYDKLSNKQKP